VAAGWRSLAKFRAICYILPDMQERRRIQDSDREAIARFIEEHWHSKLVMSSGRCYFPHELDGFIEWRDGQIAGLLTMVYEDDALQVLTLNSVLEGARIGSALMLMAIDDARARNIRRVWLTTTNDNVRAFAFYQKLGFRLVKVNVGVVDEARKVKPQIPEVGHEGIPIHDELVFELRVKGFLDA
jgi:N-acetylglutamate synthase-like GNAT family acetyltransferase